MEPNAFETPNGTPVTAVTATEMEAVDRTATESVQLALFSMMENAGRNLAKVVRRRRDAHPVVVLAGAGGNGGGGLVCARHLANRGCQVAVSLDRSPEELSGIVEQQYHVLEAMGVPVRELSTTTVTDDVIAVDALVGYGLSDPLRGGAERLAKATDSAATVVSLDLPSGIDATTGERPGTAVDADVTLTLALPKTGLGPNAGRLLLGDIAVPSAVYDTLEIPYTNPFDAYVVPIRRRCE